jgi:hypothetical protein
MAKRIKVESFVLYLRQCEIGLMDCDRSPVDFVLDILLLQRGRSLSDEAILEYKLPETFRVNDLSGIGFYCSDWIPFVSRALTPGMLMDVVDLRGRLLGNLSALICVHGAIVEASSESWSVQAGPLFDRVWDVFSFSCCSYAF